MQPDDRLAAVVRLLELTVRAAAGLASRAEVEALAMIVEGGGRGA